MAKKAKAKEDIEMAEITENPKKLAVEAEKESTTEEKTIEQKKKALLEKVLKLKEKVSAGTITSEELKEQVKAKKKSDMLIPLEEYVKAGIYLGTRVVILFIENHE